MSVKILPSTCPVALVVLCTRFKIQIESVACGAVKLSCKQRLMGVVRYHFAVPIFEHWDWISVRVFSH